MKLAYVPKQCQYPIAGLQIVAGGISAPLALPIRPSVRTITDGSQGLQLAYSKERGKLKSGDA